MTDSTSPQTSRRHDVAGEGEGTAGSVYTHECREVFLNISLREETQDTSALSSQN